MTITTCTHLKYDSLFCYLCAIKLLWSSDASMEGKLVNGSRVGQVGPVDSCGKAGDLDP